MQCSSAAASSLSDREAWQRQRAEVRLQRECQLFGRPEAETTRETYSTTRASVLDVVVMVLRAHGRVVAAAAAVGMIRVVCLTAAPLWAWRDGPILGTVPELVRIGS